MARVKDDLGFADSWLGANNRLHSRKVAYVSRRMLVGISDAVFERVEGHTREWMVKEGRL